MRFFSLLVAIIQSKSHVKLQQCVNERDISSHILPIRYDTERSLALGYPVCPTLLSVPRIIYIFAQCFSTFSYLI